MLHLQIDVTSSFKQLFRDSNMPICCRRQERSGPKRGQERSIPKRVLVVDQGLRACRRQHLANSLCIAIKRSQKECGSCLGFHQVSMQGFHSFTRYVSTIARSQRVATCLPPVFREVEPLRFESFNRT
jgi:hypothetical protein